MTTSVRSSMFAIYVKEELGKELETKLSNGYPGEALFVRCDVTKESDIQVLFLCFKNN